MTETTNAVGTTQILKAKGEQLKAALGEQLKPATPPVMPNAITGSTPKVTSDVAQTTVTVKPGATDLAKPAETAPKVRKVKSGSVEEEVPEDALIEKGAKYWGLEKHFTQKGQELSSKEKQLLQKEQEILAREASIRDTMETVLSKRDQDRAEAERRRQEELELRELENDDPVKAEILKVRRETNKTIEQIKEAFSKDLNELKTFKDETLKLERDQRDRELLSQLEEAAKQANIKPGWIIGEMASDPTKVNPFEIAKSVSDEIAAIKAQAIEEYKAQLNQPDTNRADTRIPSANAGTPHLTPTAEPLPNIVKGKQDFAQRLNKALEGFTTANMRI